MNKKLRTIVKELVFDIGCFKMCDVFHLSLGHFEKIFNAAVNQVYLDQSVPYLPLTHHRPTGESVKAEGTDKGLNWNYQLKLVAVGC